MRKFSFRLPFSFLSLATGLVTVLTITYIGSIAVVMTYAALTVEFSQSVKDDEATVAMLDASYLNKVTAIETTDYHTLGYTTPEKKIFVPSSSVTALR